MLASSLDYSVVQLVGLRKLVVRLPTKMLLGTKQHFMARLHFWRSGECEVVLYCHFSPVPLRTRCDYSKGLCAKKKMKKLLRNKYTKNVYVDVQRKQFLNHIKKSLTDLHDVKIVQSINQPQVYRL